jgi:hypothetical protein
MERRPPYLPGEKALLAKQATEKRKADAEKAKRRKAEQKAEPQQPRPETAKIEKVALKAANEQAKDEQPVEKCKAPPPFDMLDLPDAMDKMGFVVGAKLSRWWFNGRKHQLSSDPAYVYPPDMVDTKTVTLDFVLKYKKVREKYDEFINKQIYSDGAVRTLKEKVYELLGKRFIDEGVARSGNLDAISYSGGDIQMLHKGFQFQSVEVSSFDTLYGRFLTDLTASLANFRLIAAIANARVYTEKYYNYPRAASALYCCKSHVEVTHVYVYARDSYSFADIKDQKASQYLGHWNRTGVILVLEALAADRANRYGIDIEWGSVPAEPMLGPVDTLQGWFRKLRKQDVYYSVHNRDYSIWREKFSRGGDFLIFTKPVRIKLPRPIKFTTEETCKPAPPPSGR